MQFSTMTQRKRRTNYDYANYKMSSVYTTFACDMDLKAQHYEIRFV